MSDPFADQLPEPTPPRSWFHLQFSMGTLLWLMLVAGMALAWWNDRRTFDARLRKIEDGRVRLAHLRLAQEYRLNAGVIV